MREEGIRGERFSRERGGVRGRHVGVVCKNLPVQIIYFLKTWFPLFNDISC